MPLDLYYTIASPPCRSVMLLAKTLGLELNLKHVDVLKKEHLEPEFVKLLLRAGKRPDEEVTTKLEEAFQFLDKFLEEQDWVPGSTISVADYALAADMVLADAFECDISKFFNLAKWYSIVKKAIVGYDKIQDAGAAALNQMLANQPK